MNSLPDNKSLWDNALAEIELSVSKANFNTWFKDTFIAKQEGGIIHVGVPNNFVKNWLTNKFEKEIVKILRELTEGVRGVKYVVASFPKEQTGSTTQRVEVTIKKPETGSELPLDNFYIDKNDNLNPRYLFDSFVIGPFNELAFAASQAIIKQPGIVYNPLFIYGNTGHGKTHLIQAIGNHIKNIYKDKKVFYLTSENFASEYINSVQQNKVGIFKDKYKKYDVLIMDDIQFLSNKEKTQEELFHLFNTLYDNNKQIIFSSDKHPNYIPHLEERLKSRFNQGMIVDIPKPDTEARKAILEKKAGQMNLVLANEILDFLAENIDGNIRELEGILKSIICQSQLKERKLNLNEVKSLIKGNSKPKKMVSIDELVKLVADFYNIDPEAISDKTRKKEVVRPRQVTMYLLREDFSSTYPTIGEKLGGRDHTTVIHSCEKVKNDLKEDNLLAQQIEQIRSML